jgi:hypothetical protein
VTRVGVDQGDLLALLLPVTRTWSVGDPEPANADVRAVTVASGVLWLRSLPNGLFWFPAAGGLIEEWPNLLTKHGPVVVA